MRLELTKTAAACIAALAVAGCGGGGSDEKTAGDSGSTTKTLTLSGTAATGLALAGGSVTVKCSSGTGTATTATNGGYSVSITDGALPCMIAVTGTVDGTEVTLHSVTEAGTSSGNDTAAVANVTPLTELIVAKLAAAIPADLFASFGSGAQITTADLTAATAAVVTALKDATNIDLGTIDPFKTTLVAATASAPTSGNDYDKALDALKEKVSIETLPQVVAQVATTTTTGGEDKVTLTDVMAGVNSGTLEGCPTALSGKYRTIDYFGRTRVAYLDFNKNDPAWFTGDKATKLFPITKSSEACRFTAAGTNTANESVEYDIVIGRSGAGAYRVNNLTTNRSTVGYIFPVQGHTLAAVAGDWNFLQSGYMPDDKFTHYLGNLSASSAGAVSTCDYAADGSCVPDSVSQMTFATRTDGGFDLKGSDFSVPFYAYKAPNGSVALFGTTNPEGLNTETTEQTNLVATRKQQLNMPAAGVESKYWDISLRRKQVSGTPPVINAADPILADGTTVIEAIDAGSFKRKRTSDGREDVVSINKLASGSTPFNGWRSRPAGGSGSDAYPAVNQLPLGSLGIVATTNSLPAVGTNGYLSHFCSISVNRP